MTLAQARTLIQTQGTMLGDVYDQVDPAVRDALREWFCVTPGVPNLAARSSRQPLPSGNLCRCGGMMVRTGSCETCNMCGTSSGGCG